MAQKITDRAEERGEITKYIITLMKQDGSYLPIGTVSSERIPTRSHTSQIYTDVTTTVNQSVLLSVDEFNAKIVDFIADDTRSPYTSKKYGLHPSFPHYINPTDRYNDIDGIVIAKTQASHFCPAVTYFVIQKSDRGVRYLAFLYYNEKDKTLLTDMDCFKERQENALEFYKDPINTIPLIKKIEEYQKIVTFKDPLHNSKDKIEKLFGI